VTILCIALPTCGPSSARAGDARAGLPQFQARSTGTNLADTLGMSDERILRRKTRLWLYVILLLHLVCLALLRQQAAPEATHAGSRYARAAVAAPSSRA
jgi:hypothetical protein